MALWSKCTVWENANDSRIKNFKYKQINLHTVKCPQCEPSPENCKNCSSKLDALHSATQNSSDNLPSYIQTEIIRTVLCCIVYWSYAFSVITDLLWPIHCGVRLCSVGGWPSSGGAVSVISFQRALNVTLADYRSNCLHIALKFYFSRTISREEKQAQTLVLVIT